MKIGWPRQEYLLQNSSLQPGKNLKASYLSGLGFEEDEVLVCFFGGELRCIDCR